MANYCRTMLWTLMIILCVPPPRALVNCKLLKRDVKALNEIQSCLGWKVVYAWVGDDPCGDQWAGITCSPHPSLPNYQVVSQLELYGVSIAGHFPMAVTNLLDLTKLDLHGNKLVGAIPPQIGRLKKLRTLNLRWNKLQDSIPPEIGELKELRNLYLSFNNLKGPIPKELGNLPELRYLYLHENRLAGHIPSELGNLRHLRHLDVSNNRLVGTIRELIRTEGCFLSLRYLFLEHNSFSGRIPDAFYEHPHLKEMYIKGNRFHSGATPIGVHRTMEVSDTELLF
ncbi:receptor-like protein 12 isoform X2 [Cryptomeria japonica]|uniref:receptor-like protein 12 isoform X2 n=1 Tax=Cryptomeria japonica TaxID=3369 RepID=UPI0027DA9723|nr:receptor-like protein 12 isoform X2 [Cryptomeria japonica]